MVRLFASCPSRVRKPEGQSSGEAASPEVGDNKQPLSMPMFVSHLVLPASIANLVAGVVLIVAGVRGRSATPKGAKAMWVLGVVVIVSNIL
jgi:hypothetical protein